MATDRAIVISDADDPRIGEFRAIRERDLVGRSGLFIAEGVVVLRMLAAAHRSGRARAEKLLVLRNKRAGIADLIADFPADVPVYVAEQAVIDEIAGFHLHRGVLGLARRQAEAAPAALLDALAGSGLVLVGCGISNHDNMGALFRNAAAFGADAVLVDGESCDPLYRKALRVSVGAVLAVPYHRGGSAAAILDALVARGFAVLALSPRGALEIGGLEVPSRAALVVGTEGDGLPVHVLERFASVRIAQSPGLDSLNVATAAGIALHHLARAQGRIG